MNIDIWFSQYPYNFILILSVALVFILSIISLIIAITSKNRIAKMLNGQNSQNIDEILLKIYKSISSLDQFRSKTISDLGIIDERLARAVQSVETVRFNPFKGTGGGGNQSFATAILNENGDGVIISSLYSSDRVSVFAKPIQKLTSMYELTDEEVEVLKAASQKIGL